MTQTLGANQIAWCKENLRGFSEPDGKTRLELAIENQIFNRDLIEASKQGALANGGQHG